MAKTAKKKELRAPPNPVLSRALSDRGEKARLAKNLGVSPSHLGRMISGEDHPRIVELVEMSRWLNKSIFNLILPYLTEDDIRRAGSAGISEPIQAVLNNSVFEEFRKLAELLLELRNIQREKPSRSDN